MADLAWGARTEDLAISLSVDQPSYRVGEPIPLNIAFKNFGETPARVVLRSPWVTYELSVKRQDGTAVPLAQYAQQQMDRGALGPRALHELKPGEVLTDTIPLEQGFALDSPGAYTVVATREVFMRASLDQFASVRSNELTFRLVP